MKKSFFLVAIIAALFLASCGDDSDGESELPTPEARAGDPEIPAEPGYFEVDWSGTDEFTVSAPTGEYDPNIGASSGDGATLDKSDGGGTPAPGGQLKLLWSAENPVEGEVSSFEIRLLYGLSAPFELEPGTYDIAQAQTSDGSPWFDTNRPSLRFGPGSADRRNAGRTNGILIIEQVTEESVTGTIIATGSYLSGEEGTFRVAAAFNAFIR